MTASTRVCCSLISETQTAYAEGCPRQGRVRLLAWYQVRSLEERRLIFRGNRFLEVLRWCRPNPIPGRRSSAPLYNPHADSQRQSRRVHEETLTVFWSGTPQKHCFDSAAKIRCADTRVARMPARDSPKPAHPLWRRNAGKGPVRSGWMHPAAMQMR